MRTPFRYVAIVLVALVAVVALAGCGDDTEKANAAVTAANAKVTEYNKLDDEIAGIMDEINALGDGEFEKGIALVDKAAAKVEERDPLLEAVKTEFTKIDGMKVNENFKTYAKQQVEIAEKQLEANAKIGEMLATMREMLSGAQAGTLDEATFNSLNEKGDKLTKEGSALDDEITELQTVSEKYFDENLK